MRIQHIFKTKGVNDVVELVVLEGHLHDIPQNIFVLNQRTDFRTALTDHIRTVVDQSQIEMRLIKPQISIRTRTCLKHLHTNIPTLPSPIPAKV